MRVLARLSLNLRFPDPVLTHVPSLSSFCPLSCITHFVQADLRCVFLPWERGGHDRLLSCSLDAGPRLTTPRVKLKHDLPRNI